MNSKKIISVGITGMIIANSSYALIDDAGEIPESRREQASTERQIADGVSTTGDATPLPSDTVQCTDENYMPLKLLHMLMDNPSKVEVSNNFETDQEDKKVTVKLPPMITNCLKLKIEKIQKGNTIFLSVRNEYDFEKAGIDLEKFPTLESRYEQCLINEKILVKGPDGKTSLNRNAEKIKYNSIISNDMPVSLNTNRVMNVYFGSPENLGRSYGAAYSEGWVDMPVQYKGNRCLRYENMKKDGLAIFNQEQVDRAKYKSICQGGDHNQIRRALQELEDSTGNMDDVRAALEKALEKSVGKVAKSSEERLKELARKLRATKSQEEAEELAEEYGEALDELEEFVLRKKITRLNELYEKRKGMESGDERKKIDKEIKQLNKDIGKYARFADYISKGVIAKLEEFNLEETAKKAAAFKLLSYNFGKVHHKTGGQSPAAAKEAIEKEAAKYDKHYEVVERKYNARMGYETYSPVYMAEARRQTELRDNAWRKYQESMYEVQKACSNSIWGFQNNPLRCQYGMQSAQQDYQRALKVREVYNNRIGQSQGLAQQFYQLEQDALRAQEQEADILFGGSYYSLFDYSGSSIRTPAASQGQGYLPGRTNPAAVSQGPMMMPQLQMPQFQ